MKRSVLIRPLEQRDREQLLAWRNQPKIAKWMFTDHVIGVAEHDTWFDQAVAASECSNWAICLDGVPVGLANLGAIDVVNRRCALGLYVADSSARGSGVGAAVLLFLLDEAFAKRGFEKLVCEAFAVNERAIGLYQSVGFRREGVLRSHVVKSGERQDVVVLSILREEFETVRPDLSARVERSITWDGGN